MSTKESRWLWAAGPAVVMTLLAIYPVVHLRVIRGNDWNGSFAYLQGDELIYAAYVNSLRTGRPRSNNPYTGEQDQPGAPLGESAYSIQFFPAYAIALPARALGLSTSAAFAMLLVLIALSSSLILFLLIKSVTWDRRRAAAGVLFVLCLGSIPTLWGLLQILRGLPPDFTHLRFLRRFAPGFAFPFFLAFCGLVWRVLNSDNPAHLRSRQDRIAFRSSVLAGGVFAVLVFSYFYYWTAAVAWICCLGLLWVVGRPIDCEWQRGAKFLGLTAVLMSVALVPYAWLLHKRAPNQLEVTMLVHTHAPDLFRIPQLIAAIWLVLLITLSRHYRFNFRQQGSLFATSFLLLPFCLFNQQIVTGLSLQPTHYEVFVANYSVLLATVLLASDLAGIQWSTVPTPGQRVFNRTLILVVVLSPIWGLFEVARSTAKFTPAFVTRDEATPAARQLAELAMGSIRTDQVVLATDPVVADYLPTIAPQAQLWAPHMYGFAGITPMEDRRRLWTFLYYTGVHLDGGTAAQFQRLDAEKKFYFSALLGRNRIDRSQSIAWQPVQPEEYENAQRSYEEFITSFNRDAATRPTLSYVLTASDQAVDFSNLDRWYERDQGEPLGKYILYRVRLRPPS